MCIRSLLFQPLSVVPKNGHTRNSNLLVFTAKIILGDQDLLFIDLQETDATMGITQKKTACSF